MLLPLTPLQSKSARQSSAALQIFTQVTAAPEIASQTEPSGHSSVEPVVVQGAVQYPPATLVSHDRSSSQSSIAVHVPATFGGCASYRGCQSVDCARLGHVPRSTTQTPFRPRAPASTIGS